MDFETGFAEVPPLEVIPLALSGSSSNRIDLVFFSDGYTLSEREKFVEDAKRLAADVTGNQTFYTVQPLMNFWAAFTPSNESGIGIGGVAKDTPFGLYRDGTELRGVYYKHPKVARAACQSLGSGCDYPILLGNDPLYGGLGGEFTVITSSILNGPLVLRHELGHSIIDVGEEYDGGYVYTGVNALHDISEPVSWSHWLSSSPRVERTVMPLQDYAWDMLNTTTPWKTTFNSSGVYSRHLVKFSLSGIPDAKDLKVELDGVDLEWVPEPIVGLDRWHYDIYRSESLSEGPHALTFTLREPSLEGKAQLCSVEVLEFGEESEFVSTPGHYSLYPTFSDKNVTSYRPTNDDCLMRKVTNTNFCKVCMEGLWLSLLRRIHIIEGITETCEENTATGDLEKVLALELLPLAQFRPFDVAMKERYAVTWKKDGKVLEGLEDQTEIYIDNKDAAGRYSVEVRFTTEEVRAHQGELTDSREYDVSSPCT
ncbi:IgA peptidase M64-domain-containing protein [Coprinopsis sp. MPI-PUGE-AT-0042]|nr:IgA peptidase M64-domain-containing protein [Coprinopsis sp. MPI-PUGE-AT-0042]